MGETSPQPSEGSKRASKLRRLVAQLGLTGAANDVKWSHLLDAMRRRDGWRPAYRCSCIDTDGYVSSWDAEWWYHLPFPMLSVRWLDIQLTEKKRVGYLVADEVIDHSKWILEVLEQSGLCYDVVGQIARVHGYLPKSFDALD